MPRRLTPFVNGAYYHLFNRSSYRQPILLRKKDLSMFKILTHYYTQTTPPIRYSIYKLNPDRYKLDYRSKLVSIISYCFMPNHFHFCVRQEVDGGIQLFMRKLLNSYVHYFRVRYRSKGALFESVFKAVHVETEEQLIHLTRYHHLNPVSAGMVKHPKDFHHSSYNSYLNKSSDAFLDTSIVLSCFRSTKAYDKFVMDHKDYQKTLEKIKHMLLT